MPLLDKIMLRSALTAAALLLTLGAVLPAAQAAEGSVEPPAQNWTFGGFFGSFDRASAQRGFQVYKEVCSTCHSMHLMSYRDLTGLGFNADEVKAIAAEYKVADTNDAGEPIERTALPSDKFHNPFPNDKAAAAANGGKLPPDLSLMAKARGEGGETDGPNYIYAFLTGFHDAPEGFKVPDGLNYNAYFPGHVTAMPNILGDDAVTYSDGTKATHQQEAWDVVNFLMWTAEPSMEERKYTGVKVVLFLIIFAGLLYSVKRKVWASAH
ncbi:cytochrome c1 [Inquilinus sp. YAF38]|uniref:cytochrome c1 n=1 Tax=Inquilinus sp. YAF38 TaxID=3233084 RepID=UPI003F92768B